MYGYMVEVSSNEYVKRNPDGARTYGSRGGETC